MENKLKDTELDKVSGGEITEITKWKVHTVWDNDEITGEFSTKEQAEEYEKRLEKIREKCDIRDASHIDHLWFASKKNKK